MILFFPREFAIVDQPVVFFSFKQAFFQCQVLYLFAICQGLLGQCCRLVIADALSQGRNLPDAVVKMVVAGLFVCLDSLDAVGPQCPDRLSQCRDRLEKTREGHRLEGIEFELPVLAGK